MPFEAASKQPSDGTIWSPAKTSIRNRPPLISSTTLASRWAAPWSTSRAGVQVVDMRHWTFGWAITLDRGGRDGCHGPTRLHDEPTAFGRHATLLTRDAKCDAIVRE